MTMYDIHPPENYSVTDKRLDEEGMARLKTKMKKVGDTIKSDG